MKIAIQGHLDRGNEVIQILKNLGGINDGLHEGNNLNCYYELHGNVIWCVSTKGINFKYYTLEEFEKEFPFKIGDEVTIIGLPDYPKVITEMTWMDNEVFYTFGDNTWYNTGALKKLEIKEERNIKLTLDKAKEWYKKGGELKEVALQAFAEEELNPRPRSWEEFCKNNPIQDHEAFINYTNSNITICKECAGSGLGIWTRKSEKDRCKCVSQKSAEAHLAMMQLEQLRNCWRQGWVPTPGESYYTIKFGFRGLDVYCFCTIEFLSFPTREMAEEFLKCFKDLIEKAGDLI